MGCKLHQHTQESAQNSEEWVEEDQGRTWAKGQARWAQPGSAEPPALPLDVGFGMDGPDHLLMVVAGHFRQFA